MSLYQTLCDLDTVPSLLESIRLRCSNDQWFLQAEEWASNASHALELLAVHYEDETSEGEVYEEPKEFGLLKLLERHLDLLMGSEDLEKLFIEKMDDIEMVELLLCLRVDPSANDNYAIRIASENGNVAVVKRLLEARDASGRLCVDPTSHDNYAIRSASFYGHITVVNLLLDDPRVDPSDLYNEAIRMASRNGHLAVVDRLLQYRDALGRLCVDPSVKANEALRTASTNGHVEVVFRLLQDPRLCPCERCKLFQLAFVLASQSGHIELVDRLLQYRDVSGRICVDPSDENNLAIRSASANGHLAVVDRLLQDPRVNPSAENNGAIRWASAYGHLAVVKRLLEDPRVNSSAENNYAIRIASKNGHSEVVELLKAHGCVLSI